jgi:proton-coupled amino acid transporter
MLHYRGVAKNVAWKAADVLLCIFGFIVMAYTTSLTIISWASGNEEPSLPSYCDKKKAHLVF